MIDSFKDDLQFKFEQKDFALAYPKHLRRAPAPTSTQQPKSKTKNPRPEIPTYPDTKTILCSQQPFGIFMDPLFQKIQKYMEQRMGKDSIMKSLVGTFDRKNVYPEGWEDKPQKEKFDTEAAFRRLEEIMETWYGDGIGRHPVLYDFEMFKKKKMQQREAKINSIMNLIEKISSKLQQRAITHTCQKFEQTLLEQKGVKLEQDIDYVRSMMKFKYIQEKIEDRMIQVEEMERGHRERRERLKELLKGEGENSGDEGEEEEEL